MAINFLNTVAVDENVLFVDTVNDRVGIGTASPGSKLTVSSGVADTTAPTASINHTRDDADVATQALVIDMNLSGADTTTADRTNSGILVDVDSSANGDASNEHRIRGVYSDVRFTGFSDVVQSGYFYAESNNNTQKTAQLTGVLGSAAHDSNSVNGGVSNMYGVYGLASIQDLGDVDNAYGGFFLTNVTSDRGDADVGVTKGVEGNVRIDKAETINYGTMIAVSGIIDNNEDAVPTFGAQYLFKGDYQGTKGGNAYGIYTEGDKHYFDGNVGIGTDSPGTKLTVSENAAGLVSSITNSSSSGSGVQITAGNGTNNSLQIRNYAGGELMRVQGNGNVGINTTSPGFKLDVDGTFGVSDLPFNTDSVSVLVADETIGAELITNGNFATDSDWSKGPGWTISGGTANAVSATSEPMAQTVSGFAAGNIYKVRFEVTAVTNGYIRVYAYVGASGTFTNIFNSPELTTGVYESTFEFGGTNKILRFYGSTGSVGGFAGSIDNVSVKQVTSASNQVQKRELGTGAFAPTPVGAYLPLAAGSGSPLTGTLYGTSTNFSGSGDYAGSMILGNGASTAEAHLTIGQGRTDSGYSYIDLVGGTTYSDYGLRIIRNNTGANTSSAIIHRGTGNLEISTVESSSVLFKTNNTSAFTLTNTQNAIFDGYVCIGGTNPGANLEIRGTVNTDDCKIYLKENSVYGAYFKYDGDLNRGYIGGITSTTSENAVLSWSRDGSELKLVTSGSTAVTIDSNRDVTFAEDIIIKEVLLSNQENTDIDSAAAEVVAQVAHATYTAAFFDFVIKKGTNVRSGTVYACHNGDTTPLVEFTETSTNDLGDTSDVTLSVDISGDNMRLLATVTSNDWSVKSLIRAI